MGWFAGGEGAFLGVDDCAEDGVGVGVGVFSETLRVVSILSVISSKCTILKVCK